MRKICFSLIYILILTGIFAFEDEYLNAIEGEYNSTDIISKISFESEIIENITDLYKEKNLFYVVGNIFSGTFELDYNQKSLINENVIENFDYLFTGIDKINESITFIDNKRRLIVQKNNSMYIDYNLNAISSFCCDEERIWVYDKNEKKVFLFSLNFDSKRVEPLSCIEFKGDFEIEGLRIKSNKELWGCSKGKIFIFDEYFKLRHIYKIEEDLSGICFSDEEDKVRSVIVYASAKALNKVYRYELKRY